MQIDAARRAVAFRLAEARARTLLLVAPLSQEDLRRQHDPLMSPVLWDLGHIVHFEELWLTHNLEGAIEFTEMPGMYNPFEHPRATRAALPLPSLPDLLRVAAEIRADVLHGLERARFDAPSRLLHEGYVYEMVLQHEYQHNETILQTLQLKQGTPYPAPRVLDLDRGYPSRGDARLGDAPVRIPAGTYRIGTDDLSQAYDNERPAHEIRLGAFDMDRTPVTNGEFMTFMADGGYRRRDLWSDAGWRWLGDTGAQAPKYWSRGADDTWRTRGMGADVAVQATHPVCHVCYHEAEAFARWAGKRLPSEAEWEVAAAWDPERGVSRRFPWGEEPPTALHANVDQLAFGTAPIASFPHNVSPFGCHGMIGDVWEWTSSHFTGYPGFEAFPYREYSEAFFGTEYRVLRGGSWATRPGAVRNTFRNWDYPIRRQIFSGFRCARDV